MERPMVTEDDARKALEAWRRLTFAAPLDAATKAEARALYETLVAYFKQKMSKGS